MSATKETERTHRVVAQRSWWARSKCQHTLITISYCSDRIAGRTVAASAPGQLYRRAVDGYLYGFFYLHI